MVRLVLVTIISNPQKTIQVANSNKLTMKDQLPFLALAAPTSLSLINPLAVGMAVGQSVPQVAVFLFNVDRLFFSIFAIKLLIGWDTCRIKGTRIGERIMPSTRQLLLAKHHWVRIERWHRNKSRIGNLAVPVFALKWDIISQANQLNSNVKCIRFSQF
jgi:hypothetical protein